MNRRAMLSRRLLPLAACLSIAFSSACDSPAAAPAADPPLAGSTIGGPFELVDSRDKETLWSDFDGKYRIVYFGFTYCPDICPTDVQRLSLGLRKFEETAPALGAKVQPIFISIDPERDKPAVVGEFVSKFHPRLVGLTGTPEQVKAAADTFKVFYEKGEPAANGQYMMNHSAVSYLFGPKGEPLATLPTDLGPDAVAAELEKWVS